jgi:cell division septal protein FtsQ
MGLAEKSGIAGRFALQAITPTERKMEKVALTGRMGPTMKENSTRASSVEKAYNFLRLSKKCIRANLKMTLLKAMEDLLQRTM